MQLPLKIGEGLVAGVISSNMTKNTAQEPSTFYMNSLEML